MAVIVVPLPPRSRPAPTKAGRMPLLRALLEALRARPKPRRPYRRPHGPVLFSEYGPGPRR